MKSLINKKNAFISSTIGIIYFFIYYWSIGFVKFNPGTTIYLENWRELLFRRSSFFLYEPIGIQSIANLQFYIAPMNILIGLVLTLLVSINIMMVLHLRKQSKVCSVKYSGFIGILPSFLTGFACCTPSFLFPLISTIGGTATFFTKAFKWFLPLAIALLLYSTISTYRKIKLL